MGHAGLGTLAQRPGPNRAGASLAWDLFGLGRLAPVCHVHQDAYTSIAHSVQKINLLAIAAAAVGAE